MSFTLDLELPKNKRPVYVHIFKTENIFSGKLVSISQSNVFIINAIKRAGFNKGHKPAVILDIPFHKFITDRFCSKSPC